MHALAVMRDISFAVVRTNVCVCVTFFLTKIDTANRKTVVHS
jgi:hypothetical protein